MQCFLGNAWNVTPANPNPTLGGPENSLTLWGDKGDSQIVCDYGAAETFMHYLAGRFGVQFITALHRDPDQGLTSVRKLAAAAGADVMDVIHDWAAMIALDGVLDRGYTLAGGQAAQYRTETLNAGVDWRNPQSFRKPGAPPNGSDYVRFRRAERLVHQGGEIKSIAFDGSQAFPVRPVEWTVDQNPPDHGGDRGASLRRGRRPRSRHRARGEGAERRGDPQLPDPVRPRPRSRLRVRPGLDEPRTQLAQLGRVR